MGPRSGSERPEEVLGVTNRVTEGKLSASDWESQEEPLFVVESVTGPVGDESAQDYGLHITAAPGCLYEA